MNTKQAEVTIKTAQYLMDDIRKGLERNRTKFGDAPADTSTLVYTVWLENLQSVLVAQMLTDPRLNIKLGH